MISIKSLNKFFNRGSQNEIHVINDVSMDLPEKGMVAIFGKSGCGKTTLLNVIGGLDDFRTGRVTIEGQDIGKSTDDIRNKYMGYIFQNYNLLKNETCFDNVADALRLCGFTDSAKIEERVMAALKNVGMEKYYKRTPDTLSGGQQQRIAIARAIVKNPRIILADEPTGNLDEANTIAIMDLLKQIAKEHLVILVTHEANLVDYYCDTVIELSDGRIANIRNNQSANGYVNKDKNAIYLGELKKRTMTSQKAKIEYYGDLPAEPVKLRIVNSGGKMYVQIDSENVQILDSLSEVKLHEGVFDHGRKAADVSAEINMEKLPPVQADKCGKLFSFATAVKSGYAVNFKKRKVGKKLLLTCMGLFAAVFVLVCAFFGKDIGRYLTYEDSYNHNTFYIYADGTVSDKISAAVGSPDSGIDYVGVYNSFISHNLSGTNVTVHTANFETFWISSMNIDTVVMDEPVCRDMPLLAGVNSGLGYNEVVVTSAFADKIQKNDSTRLIKSYKDFIGMNVKFSFINCEERQMKISGVVRSSERVMYLNSISMADIGIEISQLYINRGAQENIDVAEGQIEIIKRYHESNKMPEVGEEVSVNGVKLTVGGITDLTDYFSWLEKQCIVKKDFEDFILDGFKLEYPDLAESDVNDEEYKTIYNAYRDVHYFEWWDYLYDCLDGYMQVKYEFLPSFYNWLYVEKGIEIAKFTQVKYSATLYYYADEYRKSEGVLPSYSELMQKFEQDGIIADETIDQLLIEKIDNYDALEYEFNNITFNTVSTNSFLVSDADYIKISKRSGETTSILKRGDIIYGPSMEIDVESGKLCLSVHSTDPVRTEEFLTRFSRENGATLYCPGHFRNMVLEGNMLGLIMGFVSLGIVLVMLSLCMYFIMRSSLMSRIKEVGIYRAIGVSKRNLIFKFLIESLVLIALTVLIGYVIASMFVFNLSGASVMSMMIFYPGWYAGIVFAVLIGVCVLCGVLPVLTLLRKTPSQILSKYDI